MRAGGWPRSEMSALCWLWEILPYEQIYIASAWKKKDFRSNKDLSGYLYTLQNDIVMSSALHQIE